MTTEVKRKSWAQFCKQFNLTNQYRDVQVSLKARGRRPIEITQSAPFLGVALSKKGRLIDGIDLFTGTLDPDRLSEPVVSIKQPELIVVEKAEDGLATRLSVKSKDGTEANIQLTGDRDDDRYRGYVAQLAYSMFERRGGQSGDDVNDWLEAERRLKVTEQSLTQ